MGKILFLTDSAANPRGFPITDETQLEETYPYLIREEFKDATFWQLSFGNITTEELINQAISYLTNWKPDFIIVQSGLADCRPEAFSESQKNIINLLPSRAFRRLKTYMYHPEWIRKRQVYRISPKNFRRVLRRFKMVFNHSKIFWLEIGCGSNYEKLRPGVNKRMIEFNKIINEIYGEDSIPVLHNILESNGFNKDNIHYNKDGHKSVSEILIKKLNRFE